MTFASAFHQGLVLMKICQLFYGIFSAARRREFGILLHESDCFFRRIRGAYGIEIPMMGSGWEFTRAHAERDMGTVNGVLTHGRICFSFQHLTNVAMNGAPEGEWE